MTTSDLLAAQHRVILNMPCSCPLSWRHSTPAVVCARCQILAEYDRHVPTADVCVHGVALGYECGVCPRGVAQA